MTAHTAASSAPPPAPDDLSPTDGQLADQAAPLDARLVDATPGNDRRWAPDLSAAKPSRRERWPFMRTSRPDLTLPHHPAVVDEFNKRANDAQLRLADKITQFAGSMGFVYLHILLFAFWMLVVERSPWPTLTLIVSLEAIFLSTFVMIGQNRQAAFQQEKADHDFLAQEVELKTNTDLTRAVHELTKEIHGIVAPHREHAGTTDE
jgi:hypothetical protein